jgi:hypothetical protein
MNFENFLQERSALGTYDSEGQFTVDLSKASEKVAAFALPSESHYILKVIQVAHRLRADVIQVQIGRFRTTLHFELDRTPSFDMDLLYRAVSDPLSMQDLLLRDLVAALYGTLHKGNSETTWSWERDGVGDRLVIDRDRRVVCQRFEADCQSTRFSFSVAHSNPWKFWEGAGRRADAAAIISRACAFSAAKIFVDGQEQSVEMASVVNNHVVVLDLPLNASEPASNILFEMASADEAAFGLLRPSLSAYLVRRDVMNVWASGMRVNNRMRPDGQSSAAWMLQFRRDDENISMRWVRKRDRYRTVLGLNVDNGGSEAPLQLKLVRSGVTMLEKEMGHDEEIHKVFKGCTLILADETLETDLTGFQYLQNEAFRDHLLNYAPLVDAARTYCEEGMEMMNVKSERQVK